MLNDIGEATIERNQDAAFTGRGDEQLVIRNTGQLLITRQGHVVACLTKSRPHRVGNVLIELDRWHDYAAGIGTIVSRARSAAYASAAGIASFGRVG